MDSLTFKDTERILKVLQGSPGKGRTSFFDSAGRTKPDPLASSTSSSPEISLRTSSRAGSKRGSPSKNARTNPLSGSFPSDVEQQLKEQLSFEYLENEDEDNHAGSISSPMQIGRHIDELVRKGKEVVSSQQSQISRTQDAVRQSISSLKVCTSPLWCKRHLFIKMYPRLLIAYT